MQTITPGADNRLLAFGQDADGKVAPIGALQGDGETIILSVSYGCRSASATGYSGCTALYSGALFARLDCRFKVATMIVEAGVVTVGTTGDDVIVGGPGADAISGGRGTTGSAAGAGTTGCTAPTATTPSTEVANQGRDVADGGPEPRGGRDFCPAEAFRDCEIIRSGG